MTLSPQLLPRQDGKSDHDQLVQLFWNRAQLKKEFDSLRAESRKLAEQLRKQEAVTLRVQQRLEQLESSLATPESAAQAIAHYHLRGVWDQCHSEIERVAREGTHLHRERERVIHLATFRQQLNESLQNIQRRSAETSRALEALNQEIRDLREQRASCQGFWRWPARRQITAAMRVRREQHRAIVAELGRLAEELTSRAAEPPPAFRQLSVQARRNINLMVIAAAQELYLLLQNDQIASLARDAAMRTLADVHYGTARECRALCRRVEGLTKAWQDDTGLPVRMRRRADYLRAQAEYGCDTDTVPVAATLGRIMVLVPTGPAVKGPAVNVLADEYWDIFSVLLS